MGDVVDIGKGANSEQTAIADNNAHAAETRRAFDIGATILLPLIEYERCRLSVAKKVGIRASVLDRIRARARSWVDGYSGMEPILPPTTTIYTAPDGARSVWLAIADRKKDFAGALDGTVLAMSLDGEAKFKIMQWSKYADS